MIMLWLSILLYCQNAEWGFFGHRLINRVAVYTVPTEMIGWYKPYIDYIAEHAVDPDKRRYATKHEAVRHYIDLDHWGTLPFDHVPRTWDKILALNIEAFHIDAEDTIFLLRSIPVEKWGDSITDLPARLALVRKYYLPQYYEDEPFVISDSFKLLFHGIFPYHLQSMQLRLTVAFQESDLEKVLRVSAEMGHYIADACVPLHTTSNYNGQLTNQVGIHAFWESRIPELLAVEEFDMAVGTAKYIHDPVTYFWDLVLSSHKEVHRVLEIEKHLSQTFPSDKQFCFEDRLQTNIRTQCPEYARAFDEAMDGMVEDRFRLAVKAIGDAWYTAWIDAGQPPPPTARSISKSKEDEELEDAVGKGRALGREHGN